MNELRQNLNEQHENSGEGALSASPYRAAAGEGDSAAATSALERGRCAKTPDEGAVRDFFDRQAESYSGFFSPLSFTGSAVLFQHRLALSVEMTRGSRGALLDCASGTGEITRAVIAASQFDSATVNDFSPAMLERCRATCIGLPINTVNWSGRSVFDFPDAFQANSFDVALCLGLIAHCGNLPALLRSVALVLKPGGVALVQSSLLDHFGDRITKFISQATWRRVGYKVHSFYLRDILDEAAASGLRPLEIRRFGVGIPFGDRLMRPVNYRIEKKFALACRRNGGEAVILLRKFA